MSEPAPRFRDGYGNDYLGLDVADAENLEGLLGALLELLGAPSIHEELSELLSTDPFRHLSDDLARQYFIVRHLLASAPAGPRADRADRPAAPLRDGAATGACPVCGTSFAPAANKRYCCPACKATAWRRRHRPAVPPVELPAARPRRSFTVYECADCGTRSLGEQRCEGCGLFMARVGVGGTCPGCDSAITVGDLLDDLGDREVMPRT
ncbi:MAG: hypothetical protein ACRDJU_00515 [Actinomycetota bacterium]